MSKKLVAVYGTLMSGQPNHRWMKQAGGKFIGKTTTDKPYHMVSFGGFPAVSLHNPSEENMSVIHVELWEVEREGLIHLDSLEGFPNFYNRSLLPFGDLKAWVYHLDTRDAYVAPPVEHGDWARYVEERTGLQMTEELIGNA